MFNLFTKEKETKNDESHLSLISIAALLVHSAKIDQNFTTKEKNIIKNALIEMGAAEDTLDEIIKDAETKEKDANQILEFTRDVKSLSMENKIIIVETLWRIILSDGKSDIYENNLMRRLAGLLYLDDKVIGETKDKVLNKK